MTKFYDSFQDIIVSAKKDQLLYILIKTVDDNIQIVTLKNIDQIQQEDNIKAVLATNDLQHGINELSRCTYLYLNKDDGDDDDEAKTPLIIPDIPANFIKDLNDLNKIFIGDLSNKSFESEFNDYIPSIDASVLHIDSCKSLNNDTWISNMYNNLDLSTTPFTYKDEECNHKKCKCHKEIKDDFSYQNVTSQQLKEILASMSKDEITNLLKDVGYIE